MVIGPAAERPMEFALRLLDGAVVDRREAPLHQTGRVELPIFVAIGTEPESSVVVPLIREADGNPVSVERPQFLDQPVIELPRPLAGEEFDDLTAANREFCAIAPLALFGVDERHALRVATVPAVLGHANFCDCGVARKGGYQGSHAFLLRSCVGPRAQLRK